MPTKVPTRMPTRQPSPKPPSKWIERTVYGNWRSVASSSDGVKIVAVAVGWWNTTANLPGSIWTSTDSGATWTERTAAGGRDWQSVASSSDGTMIVAAVTGPHGSIWTLTDSGATWTEETAAGPRWWRTVASSSDGTKIVAAVYGGSIWTSSSMYGWAEQIPVGSRNWTAVASSSDGTKVAAVVAGGSVWTGLQVSPLSGIFVWTERTNAGARNWQSVASSADGTKIAAAEYGGYIWISTDWGASWMERSAIGRHYYWAGVALSSDGTKLVAVVYGGNIWTSSDLGATWACSPELGTNFGQRLHRHQMEIRSSRRWPPVKQMLLFGRPRILTPIHRHHGGPSVDLPNKNGFRSRRRRTELRSSPW